MILELGIIAGAVLNFIEEIKEPFTIDDIKASLDYPEDHVLMSIGWLVREGLIFVKRVDGKNYICCCKNDSVHCP